MNRHILWKCMVVGQSYIGPRYMIQKRKLYTILNSILNSYDSGRVKEAGAERACSEWLLRIGAKLRYVGHKEFLEEFNSLPPTNFEQFKIEEIDFTDTLAMGHGFSFLQKLKNVKKIKISNGQYMGDGCISNLHYVKNTLEHLHLCNCPGISPAGIQSIMELKNLRKLVLENLPRIEELSPVDKETMLKYLQRDLPKCDIDFFKEVKNTK